MSKMDEKIVVVNREKLFDNERLTFQGFKRSGIETEEILERMGKYWEIMRRGDAETNFAYKQPIPYGVLTRGDEVFLYCRLSGGGETRLHGKFSIGVGGHMQADEGEEDIRCAILTNLKRELREELKIPRSADPVVRVLGLINDDSNDVSKVHIGILVNLDFDEDVEITVRETDSLQGNWVKIKDLLKSDIRDRLESWSKIALKALK